MRVAGGKGGRTIWPVIHPLLEHLLLMGDGPSLVIELPVLRSPNTISALPLSSLDTERRLKGNPGTYSTRGSTTRSPL